MSKPLTIYRATGKSIGLVFLFKYDLNGHLKAFEIAEGELNEQQRLWLFSTNFPATEEQMKSWSKIERFTKVFKVDQSVPDLSFEAFWKVWNLKIKKELSEKAWNKLSEADRIKCWITHPRYHRHLDNTKQAKAHLVTWINQKRFNDEY